MHYPMLTAELRLLMLMHQCLQSIRDFGSETARLRFREEPTRLILRAESTESEEVSYGTSDSKQPGDILEALRVKGYVNLSFDESQSHESKGIATITEQGLRLIDYRKAYESNLPRAFLKPEFSLHGLYEIGLSKLWRATWQGRQISVRNRQILRLKPRIEAIDEYLDVDGRRPPAYRVERKRFSKDLYCELDTPSGVSILHSHIGLTAPVLSVGCQISVDGVMIGGDVGRRFLT